MPIAAYITSCLFESSIESSTPLKSEPQFKTPITPLSCI